ncbi:MAG: [acyl-carrier-protein] S-malonyltransferase [Verrucomicrobia bacterium A1]|nr:MAG: [acyl-carrier-protein] S-malonyltransferase [Verrucomicrobia bacterium A1]
MKSLAWLFPGQGAQAVGMGRDLAEQIPAAAAMFRRAGEVLGFDLARVCFEGPEAELTRSDRAQPAIFVVSAACAEALTLAKPGLAWAFTAGHSLGEWTALYAAGVVSFDDALRVLQARGRFMQQACEQNPGAMLAVLGLPREAVEQVAARSGAEVANFNEPAQTVLSGTREAIDAAERVAGELKAKRAVRLPVAGAFHSSLMKPAADQLAGLLAGIDFKAPRFPVMSNATGAPHGGPDETRREMVRQVTSSVRWVDIVQYLAAQGVGRYVECGPGRVLTGLVKRIDREAELHTIPDLPGLQAVSGKI